MKKGLLALALTALLVSCNGSNSNYKEIQYAEFASNIQNPSTLKKPKKCVVKYKGTLKTKNANLIPTWTGSDVDKKIDETCKYNIGTDGSVTLVEGTQPQFTLAPARLEIDFLPFFTQTTATDLLGYNLTCASQYYSGALLRAVNERVGFQNHPLIGGDSVMYYMYDFTFNKEQWVAELHIVAKLYYYKNTQTAYAITDTVGTYSYTF